MAKVSLPASTSTHKENQSSAKMVILGQGMVVVKGLQ
jgi:hypothetical protein